MSDIPSVPPSAMPPRIPGPKTSPLLVILGILLMLGWWVVNYFVAGFMLIMLAMANDSGSVPSEQHASLIMMCMTGQAIVALSGTFAGLGCFWSKRRKLMFLLFGFLLIFGIGTVVFSFVKFANVAGESNARIEEKSGPAPASAPASETSSEG